MIDIGYAGALLGGILTLLSPCSAVLLPAFFAYAFTSGPSLLGRTGLFYAGLLTTLVPLGVAASSLGTLLTRHRAEAIVVLSAVVIVLGVLQALGVSLPGLTTGARARASADPTSAVSVYLLGTGYGLAGVCSGPILGSLLAVAALGSDPVYGAVLLAVYAFGMVVPVVLLAAAWDRFDLGRRSWLKPRGISFGRIHTTTTGLVSGLLFIGIGVVMLTTEGTANLGGVLTINAQYAAEVGVQSWSARIPDLLVVAVVAAGLAGLVAVAVRRRNQRVNPQPIRDDSATSTPETAPLNIKGDR